jgi:hypothetical protein
MSKYFIALAPVFYLINVKTVSKGIVRLHKPHGASYPWRAILALNRLVYVGKLVRHLTIHSVKGTDYITLKWWFTCLDHDSQ